VSGFCSVLWNEAYFVGEPVTDSPEKQHFYFLYAFLLAHSCTTYRKKTDAFCCYQSIYTL